MGHQEPPPIPTSSTLPVDVPEAPELPLIHVNALNLRYSLDEFFFILAVVLPPQAKDASEAASITSLQGQPVFRFALSRQTMARFLALMQTQLDQQTATLEAIMRQQEQQGA